MSRRTLYIVLVVSLALNIFGVGALIGAGAMGFRWHGIGSPPGGRGGMAPASRALSPEHREAWSAVLRGQATTSGATLRQARMLRRGAWMRFASDPLDTAGVLADLQRSRALEAQGRGELDAEIVAFAAKLPAAERVKFADALMQPRGKAQREGWLGRRAGPDQGHAGLPDR
jgi:uncharacterized membrane protein